MIIKLTIPGVPKPKQSFRFAKMGNFVRKYQTAEVKNNERSIQMIVKEQLPAGFQCTDKPIVVTRLLYLFPPLKTMTKAQRESIAAGYIVLKTTKPDVTDNLSKGLFDALQGIVYMNDSQVCRLQDVVKGYHRSPGIYLELQIFETISLLTYDLGIK